MIIEITSRTWMTSQGLIKTYAVKKEGLPFKEFNQKELQYFLKGVEGNGTS